MNEMKKTRVVSKNTLCNEFQKMILQIFSQKIIFYFYFRESSRDDLTSMGEQIFDYEDRFRVDRRKLELMIIGEKVIESRF